MTLRNKLISVAAATALTLGSAGLSSVASARSVATEGASNEGSAADQTPAYEQVDSFSMWSRAYSWEPVDDSTIIFWPTPFEPYLVRLAHPSHDMSFAQRVVVTSTNHRVAAKYDAVTIRGFRYPIQSIFKITREAAKNLTGHEPGNS